MPAGHTASWGKGYPELLTDCYDAQERPTGLKGPINPARNETYALLWQLLREAATAFPDSYIHLGGDEVPFDCWQVLLPPALLPARIQNCVIHACCRHPFLSSHSLQAGMGGSMKPEHVRQHLMSRSLHVCKRCTQAQGCMQEALQGCCADRVCDVLLQSSPEIRAFMAENGLKSVSELETYFEGRVLGLARQAGRNYIVWQVGMIHCCPYIAIVPPACTLFKVVCIKACRQSLSAKAVFAKRTSVEHGELSGWLVQEILDNNVQIEKDTVVHVWKWWAAAGSQAQQKAAGPAVCELSAGCRPETRQYQDAGLSAWGAELAKVTSKVTYPSSALSERL